MRPGYTASGSALSSKGLALRSLIAAATGLVLVKSGMGGGAVSVLPDMVLCCQLEHALLAVCSKTSSDSDDFSASRRTQHSKIVKLSIRSMRLRPTQAPDDFPLQKPILGHSAKTRTWLGESRRSW
jgi:hypothetical protein